MQNPNDRYFSATVEFVGGVNDGVIKNVLLAEGQTKIIIFSCDSPSVYDGLACDDSTPVPLIVYLYTIPYYQRGTDYLKAVFDGSEDY